MEFFSAALHEAENFKTTPMKKLLILVLMVTSTALAQAGNQPKTVKTNISAVTVFLSGAQITSTAETNLAAGSSTLVFGDLTADMDPQSIQVRGSGNFSILSVAHQLNYLKTKEQSAEIRQLSDSIALLTKEINYQNAILSVYNDEESLVLINKELGGSQNGVKVADIREAADFYRTRLTEIRTIKLKLAQLLQQLNQRRDLLSQQLSTLSSANNEPAGEIVVIISADAATAATFTLTYRVFNAGWTPSYDLRATDVNHPVELVCKGNIWQNTGKNWDQVKLKLSTGNPAVSGTRPILYPWYLSYLSGYAMDCETRSEAAPLAQTYAVGATSDRKEASPARTGAHYTDQQENQTTMEYTISIPYSIPCDGKPKIVELQEHQLPATYQYYATPRLDRDAFLLARISGWEQYNLLAGEANIFFEGTFLGKSNINPRFTRDTLEISLGRDQNISITRDKLLEFSSTRTIGTNTKETFTFEINVRNKKKTAISLLLEDQLPLSTDKNIVVEALELSGGFIEAASGKVSWKLNLKPAESVKIKFSYSVRYPRDKQINL